MNKQIQELSGHYIICAKGIIGEYVIEEFVKIQRPFVAVTSDQKLAEELMEHNILVLHENPAEDETLLAAGIARATGLITVLEDDKTNLFVVLSARGLNPSIRIIAQAIEKNTMPKIKKAGFPAATRRVRRSLQGEGGGTSPC